MPAVGVAVSLHRLQMDSTSDTSSWIPLSCSLTNGDGRCGDLMLTRDTSVPAAIPLTPGVYRLSFETESYFKSKGVECFFPSAEVRER